MSNLEKNLLCCPGGRYSSNDARFCISPWCNDEWDHYGASQSIFVVPSMNFQAHHFHAITCPCRAEGSRFVCISSFPFFGLKSLGGRLRGCPDWVRRFP